MSLAGCASARIPRLLAIVLTCVAVDQALKELAVRYFPRGEPWSFLGDTIRIRYTQNPGAFLGLGGSLPADVRFWLLTVLNGVILLAILWLLLSRRQFTNSQFVAFSLLLGGGTGNQIDRILRDGLVCDFLNIGLGGLRTGIFNVADAAITTGVGLVVYGMWRERRHPKRS